MKRLDVLLLTALALACAAQIAGVRSSSPPSWREQEQQTGKEIRRALETDRETLGQRLRENPSLRRRFRLAMLGLVLIALGSLVEWGRLFLRWMFHAPSEPPVGSPAPPAWGFRQIFRIALGVLLIIECSVLLRAVLFKWLHPAWLDRRIGTLADTLLVDLGVAASAAWFLPRCVRSVWNPGRIAASVRAAFRAYLFSAPLLFLLLMAVAIFLNLFRIEPPPQPVFTLYLTEQRTAVVRTLLALAVIAGPVAEELFFRGLLYGWLRTRVGIGTGIWLSAVLFALLHMEAAAFFPILGLGLLFGWVYERTGSLAAPIAIHIFHNAGMLYVASVIKALVNTGAG